MQTNKKTDEKFSKGATKLVINIIRDLNKIKNLSKNNYVEEDHKDKIISKLRKELDITKKSLKEDGIDEEFKLD
jgi:RNA polymerase-interacting CarD/CdnL/TRCF family regulator